MRSKLMGRKKMYFTVKEKKEAQKKWQMNYYYRNKETILKKMKEKYRQRKLNLGRSRLTKELYGE
jgi:hypothetical protein